MKEILARLFTSPGTAVELMVATLFANILVLATPIFVMHVLNRYVAFGVDTTLVTLAAGAIVAIAFEFGFRKIRVSLIENKVAEHDDQKAVVGVETLVRTPLALFSRLSANARQQAVAGADTVRQAYSAANLISILDIPFAFFFIAVLYLLSPILAGIAFLFASATLLMGVWTLVSVRGATQKRQAASAARSQLAATTIKSAETPRLFDAVKWIPKRWTEASVALSDADADMSKRQDTVQALTQSVIALLSVALISVGAYLAVHGALDIGALVGANILAARAISPIARFAGLARSFAAARDASRVLDELSRVKKREEGGTSLSGYRGKISFEDASFSHTGSKTPLFESLAISLEAGSTLAVSGPNGSGKTTLARLAAGLLEPSRGRVLVDGVDMQQVDPDWWRSQISYLPQEPRFLPTSIAENLIIANPKLDEGELNALIQVTGLRRFIDESADGMARVLSDGGDELALGIRRRLALARALAVGGPLMIVDEPTEAMDDEGKAMVYQVMNRHAQSGGTIIACSHDPMILKGADWVIDLGRKPKPRVSELPKPASDQIEVGE